MNKKYAWKVWNFTWYHLRCSVSILIHLTSSDRERCLPRHKGLVIFPADTSLESLWPFTTEQPIGCASFWIQISIPLTFFQKRTSWPVLRKWHQARTPSQPQLLNLNSVEQLLLLYTGNIKAFVIFFSLLNWSCFIDRLKIDGSHNSREANLNTLWDLNDDWL